MYNIHLLLGIRYRKAGKGILCYIYFGGCQSLSNNNCFRPLQTTVTMTSCGFINDKQTMFTRKCTHLSIVSYYIILFCKLYQQVPVRFNIVVPFFLSFFVNSNKFKKIVKKNFSQSKFKFRRGRSVTHYIVNTYVITVIVVVVDSNGT